ncbi:MAG: SEC-C metal-binding domain-containing protein, partial [Candidatus Thiodiazotropha endolucinida]
LLSPILAFTAATDWKGHDKSYDVVESIQLKIAPNARQIHAYWLSRRDEIPQDELIKKREQTPVGRNDPCPCGSGKKYKKCCLH